MKHMHVVNDTILFANDLNTTAVPFVSSDFTKWQFSALKQISIILNEF